MTESKLTIDSGNGPSWFVYPLAASSRFMANQASPQTVPSMPYTCFPLHFESVLMVMEDAPILPFGPAGPHL